MQNKDEFARTIVENSLGITGSIIHQFPTGLSHYVFFEVGEINGHHFAIYERLKGDDLENVYSSLSDQEKKSIAEEVADIQQKISAIDRGHFESIIPWHKFLLRIISRSKREVLSHGLCSPKYVDLVQEEIEKQAEYFQAIKPTVFLHDLSVRNVIVSNGKVTGIIDVDDVWYGDPLLAIGRGKTVLRATRQDTKLINRWCEYIALSAQEMKMIELYALLYCLRFMGTIGTRLNGNASIQTNPENARLFEQMADEILDQGAHLPQCVADMAMPWGKRGAKVAFQPLSKRVESHKTPCSSTPAIGRLSDMQKSQRLWKLYSIFWGLYGRYAWDDHSEPARVSEPPEHIVEIVQNRRIKPDEWVLDAGCGTGNYTIALAKAGFQVISTDFAAGMLAKAQEKITSDLSTNISFRRADLNSPLNYPEDKFDHVISISVLQAVAYPNFTLGELYRILKPGGTIVLSLPKENSKILSLSLRELIRYRRGHLERRTAGKIVLVILKCIGDKYHASQRWTVSQTHEMLNKMGFETISIEEGRQILAVAVKR